MKTAMIEIDGDQAHVSIWKDDDAQPGVSVALPDQFSGQYDRKLEEAIQAVIPGFALDNIEYDKQYIHGTLDDDK